MGINRKHYKNQLPELDGRPCELTPVVSGQTRGGRSWDQHESHQGQGHTAQHVMLLYTALHDTGGKELSQITNFVKFG